MKLLADECVAGATVRLLRAEGHDVVWVAEWGRDPGDDLIIRADSFVMMSEIDALAEQGCSGDRAFLVDRSYRDSHPDTVFWRFTCLRTLPGLRRLQDQR